MANKISDLAGAAGCPCFSNSSCCQVTGLRIADNEGGRSRLCKSEDHDLCPVYLAYLLCHSRPLRGDHDWFDAERVRG